MFNSIFTSRKTIEFIILVFVGSFVPAHAEAQEDDPRWVNPALVIDRLHITFTGVPASRDTIALYADGSRPLSELVDQLRLNPATELKLAHFWLRTWKLNLPVSWQQVHIERGEVFNGEESRGAVDLVDNIRLYGLNPRDIAANNRILAGTRMPRVGNDMHPTCDRHKEDTDQDFFFRLPMNDTDHPEYDNLVNCSCDAGTTNPPVLVTAWWDRETQVLSCSSVEQICGTDLNECWPHLPNHTFKLLSDVRHALTLEPGLIAAKNIVYRQPWEDVLTTSQSYGNGALLAYLNKSRHSEILQTVSPPGSFPDRLDGSRFLIGTQNPNSLALRDINGSEFVAYERGSVHSGVFTTMAFQLAANGWRAMLNQSRQGFLCKEFSVPEGIPNTPPDDGDNIGKNPYCLFCHTVIEPAKKFWQHWPDVGDTNYRYFPTPLEDVGEGFYLGRSGSTVRELASIYSTTIDFKECAAKRAFSFLLNREMSTAEEEQLLPSLVRVYEETDGVFWELLKSIVDSQIYKGRLEW